MRFRRPIIAAIVAVLSVAALPSLAGARSFGAAKGTWTFTDMTPDPTTLQNDATQHCHGTLPSGPSDVNSQKLTAKKAGTLSLVAHNALDWAVEVRDSKGNVITGTDGADSTTAEDLTTYLSKGSYEVVYCNFSGEPSITVDYSFK